MSKPKYVNLKGKPSRLLDVPRVKDNDMTRAPRNIVDYSKDTPLDLAPNAALTTKFLASRQK